MTSPKYMMITVARAPGEHYSKAVELLGTLAEDLKKGAGAMTTRHGVIATGENTNHLIFFQTYDEMNGFDRAFDVYGKSKAYKSLMQDVGISLTLRNILRIEDVGLKSPSSDMPAYGVITRAISDNVEVKAMQGVVPHFENNGAMILRYCTILTGPAANHRLLVVGYPSMDSIEKTYDDLIGSPEYDKVMETHHVEWRNIVKVNG